MKVVKRHNHAALDRLTYVSGVLLPILTLPQAYSVLVDKSVEGVSLPTWSFYLLSSSLFAIFGIIHREKLLMMTYIPFVFVEAAIVVGILINS
jgi:uncharacterized protein with PQ loop repeat